LAAALNRLLDDQSLRQRFGRDGPPITHRLYGSQHGCSLSGIALFGDYGRS
jgi:hypothetical protein